MFWCVYVLDRRFSFMKNLPFVLRDEDIDPTLPLPVSFREALNMKLLIINAYRILQMAISFLW